VAQEYLVLLHETRVCRKCHERTRWTLESLLWSDKGICLAHANGIYERCGPSDSRAAFRAIVAGLGPVDEIPDEPTAESFAPEPTSVRVFHVLAGVWSRLTVVLTPRYVGRCVGCSTAIRRYGAAGRPLCDSCAAPKPETNSTGDGS
jgi:hypothetical protein